MRYCIKQPFKCIIGNKRSGGRCKMSKEKRKVILDSMQKLMAENKAQSASVNDIAKEAGISKGSIYYYFKSKDDIVDAVLERSYKKVLEESWQLTKNKDINALEKMRKLFDICAYPHLELQKREIENYLHLQENTRLHQKFLIITVRELTPILTEIINQGINEKSLVCHYPEETAEITLSIITWLLDPNMFPCEYNKKKRRLKALSLMLEDSMETPKGSFNYLFEID